jgi:hypothetical protein
MKTEPIFDEDEDDLVVVDIDEPDEKGESTRQPDKKSRVSSRKLLQAKAVPGSGASAPTVTQPQYQPLLADDCCGEILPYEIKDTLGHMVSSTPSAAPQVFVQPPAYVVQIGNDPQYTRKTLGVPML